MSIETTALYALPWIPVAAAIIGVSLGFALSRIPAWRDRRRKALGYFGGINAEITYAAKHARLYIEGDEGSRYVAPAYRLLTRFTVEGSTWLASEGFLNDREIEAMLAYLAGAEEFNRCLEECASLAAQVLRRQDDMIGAEELADSLVARRAAGKAANLIRTDGSLGSALKALDANREAAIRAHMSRPWKRRPHGYG